MHLSFIQRTRLISLIVFMAFVGIGLQSAFAQESDYYKQKDLPDAVYFLPAPPDTSDMLFAADFNRWIWGKSLRGTPRGEQASWESLFATERMATVFGEAMGISITKEGTPAIWNLMRRAGHSGNNGVRSAKKYYMRVRPFARLNEHVSSKYDDEEGLRKNGSYPSGHTAYGWGTALALAEMLPEMQDTILRRGYEYGDSRVIVGAHWQSDVDAGRLASAAAIARVHRHPDYARDLAAARAEYLKLNPSITQKKAGYPDVTRILDAPVTTESPLYYGDVAAYWAAKPERATVRGLQAVADADDSIEALLKGLSMAAGAKISSGTTPHTVALIAWTREVLLAEAARLKATTFRERPYVRFGEPTLIPEEEAASAGTSSYPSASATLGWGLALTMIEIIPDHSEEILKYGFELGYSRIITGYHFASDVQAGRILATCALCRIHNDPTFRNLLEKAKEEWPTESE